MPGFNHHSDATRLDPILQSFGDLGGEPLLHLQAAGKGIHQAGDFAQPQDLALGQIRYMAAAKKGQHMVLAEAEHLDVAHDDHLIVVDGEQGAAQDAIEVGAVATGKVGEGFGVTFRGLQEAFAIGVLAQVLQQRTYQVCIGSGRQFGRHIAIVFWDLRRTLQLALGTAALLSLVWLGGCGSRARLGQTVPDFQLRLLNGQKVTLASYRGRVLVLNFWASWCPPCIEETPALNTMAQQFPSGKVVVLGVSIDEDPVAYRTFLARYHIRYPTARDPSQEVMHSYGTRQIPETYIIGPDGRLVRKLVSVANWTSPDMIAFLRRLAQSERRTARR